MPLQKRSQAKKVSAETNSADPHLPDDTNGWSVLESENLPLQISDLSPQEYEKIRHSHVESVGNEGFAKGYLGRKATMTFSQEATVFIFFAIMGICFLSFPVLLFIALYSRNIYFIASYFIYLIIAVKHPIPYLPNLHKSKFAQLLCRYFSFRIVWETNQLDSILKTTPFICAAGPHGVFPFGQFLFVFLINTYLGVPFIGTAASVVFRTPVMRLLTMVGSVPVSKKDIGSKLKDGLSIGIIPDGIAGMFYAKDKNQLFCMKSRKGIAKFALQTGTPVLPACVMGNTESFKILYDPFGVMKWLSRKLRVAVFMFWGRYGFLVPFRNPIVFHCGRLIKVKKSPDPTQNEIDVLHKKIMESIENLFETHKHSYGWGEKKLVWI